MRTLLAFCIVFLLLGAASAKDYDRLDRHGNYKGYYRSSDTDITKYDRSNRQEGWLDRDTGATFDRNNNFRGWIMDNDDD